MISPLNDAAVEVGALLLAVPDAASRASIIAVSIVEQIPECACAIHRFSAENGDESWTVIGAAGEISVERVTMQADNRLIAPCFLIRHSRSSVPLQKSGARTTRT